MKTMQKKVVGVVIVAVALGISTMVYSRTFEKAELPINDLDPMPVASVASGAAITVDGQDVFAIQNGTIFHIDRNTLRVKNSQHLNTSVGAPVSKIN